MDAAERRTWTDKDLHKLFKDYFNKEPGICPTCGQPVSMMMDHKDDMAILTVRCRECKIGHAIFC